MAKSNAYAASVLIWFDPSIDSREDTIDVKERLREIDDDVRFYTDLELCLAFIRSIESAKVFLITPGSWSSKVLSRIHFLPQIESIFIFCMQPDKYQHLLNEYPQVVGIYDSTNSLCVSVQESIELAHVQLKTSDLNITPSYETIDISKPINYHKNPTRYKAVSIVVVSDTHNNHEQIDIPDGDIFLHCGDFTNKSDWEDRSRVGDTKSTAEFNRWLGTLPHRHKIVISGNHELGFEQLSKEKIQSQILSNCRYLKNELVEIEGISIFGCSWAFDKHPQFLWPSIPAGIDILMTHVPPEFVLDLASEPEGITSTEPCLHCNGQIHGDFGHWGSKSLADAIFQRVKPKIHCFGHVHDAAGYLYGKDSLETLFINAAADETQKCYKFTFYVDTQKRKS